MGRRILATVAVVAICRGVFPCAVGTCTLISARSITYHSLLIFYPRTEGGAWRDQQPEVVVEGEPPSFCTERSRYFWAAESG